ncbi:hypothetical protein DL98DRAFT_567365 [Cadophora sp. DSE1049]|nr:hypothetical protein DL98DRAFT_567365 [Cadophora sp. DSE1049]
MVSHSTSKVAIRSDGISHDSSLLDQSRKPHRGTASHMLLVSRSPQSHQKKPRQVEMWVGRLGRATYAELGTRMLVGEAAEAIGESEGWDGFRDVDKCCSLLDEGAIKCCSQLISDIGQDAMSLKSVMTFTLRSRCNFQGRPFPYPARLHCRRVAFVGDSGPVNICGNHDRISESHALDL